MSKESKEYSFLVVGGGISGLTYALEVAEHGSVAVLFKKAVSESSTWYAQGGIAAVQEEEEDDSLESHVQDTLIAGAGICNEKIVEIVVKEGPERVKELIERGTQFDLDTDGEGYSLHKEGGHSNRRILHSRDATGKEIQRALTAAALKHPNIDFLVDTNAIDIITSSKLSSSSSSNQAIGVYALTPSGEVVSISARKILIATGGAGKVYLYTSNPDVASGDGIAMCSRAGVSVANMEFFQFHPTCLFHPKAKSFLITEAMRGEGAKLLRINGQPFMSRYHKLEELAPRDIVARAIDSEMKEYGEEHVLLDISHKPATFVKKSFPTIYQRCLSFGIDITKEPIPVVPAAHYCCGGVMTGEHGETSIENLYVAGESAYTGLHGANRLASNSLLEGLVFAKRAARHSIESLEGEKSNIEIPKWDSGKATDSNEEVIISQNWDEIRRFMWNYVGIVRSEKRLERALRRSEMIQKEIEEYYWNFLITSDLLELRNLSLVSNLVIRSAMSRKESRGLHYTVDYPDFDDVSYKEPTIQGPI